MYNDGTAALTDCTVSGNSVPADVDRSSHAAERRRPVQRRHGHADQHDRRRQWPAAATLGSYSGSHDLIGGNPLLAPLGDYGGPTQTMALLPGSPAIGAGGSVTTLSSAGVTDTSSASVTVANGLVFAGSSLPVLSSGSYFMIECDSEQMAVVGVTLNADNSATLDVVRGANGTTAATHPAAPRCSSLPTSAATPGAAPATGAYQDQGFTLTPVARQHAADRPVRRAIPDGRDGHGQQHRPIRRSGRRRGHHLRRQPRRRRRFGQLLATTAAITGRQASVTATANAVAGSSTVTASAAGVRRPASA